MPPNLLNKRSRQRLPWRRLLLKLWRSNKPPMKLKWLPLRKRGRRDKRKKKRRRLANSLRRWLLRLLPKKPERRLRKRN